MLHKAMRNLPTLCVCLLLGALVKVEGSKTGSGLKDMCRQLFGLLKEGEHTNGVTPCWKHQLPEAPALRRVP